MGTLALILLPAALFLGGLVAWATIRRSGGIGATVPAPLLALTGVLLFLGLFVAPRVLGFTFILLPFLLIIRPRRRRRNG